MEKKEQVKVKKPEKDAKSDENTEVRTTTSEESLGTKELILVVRLGTDGQSFNVIQQPHYEALPSSTRLTAVADKMDQSKRNARMEDELKQFTTQFFTSFTTNSIEEMSYLMEIPESMKDLYDYKGLEGFVVYDGEEEGEYIVKSLVLLEKEATGLRSKHPYTLVISKQNNNKYYVEELKHTIGG